MKVYDIEYISGMRFNLHSNPTKLTVKDNEVLCYISVIPKNREFVENVYKDLIKKVNAGKTKFRTLTCGGEFCAVPHEKLESANIEYEKSSNIIVLPITMKNSIYN